MELSELREMTLEELKERERELRKKQFELRISLRDSHASLREYREVRKERARILTIMREKELNTRKPEKTRAGAKP